MEAFQVTVHIVFASCSARVRYTVSNIVRCTTQHAIIHPAGVFLRAQGMLGPVGCVSHLLFFLCFLGDATSLLYCVGCLGRSGSLS